MHLFIEQLFKVSNQILLRNCGSFQSTSCSLNFLTKKRKYTNVNGFLTHLRSYTFSLFCSISSSYFSLEINIYTFADKVIVSLFQEQKQNHDTTAISSSFILMLNKDLTEIFVSFVSSLLFLLWIHDDSSFNAFLVCPHQFLCRLSVERFEALGFIECGPAVL